MERIRQDVEAVRRNIMRGGTEGQQAKEHDCPLNKMRGGDHQSHNGEQYPQNHLSGPDPLTACFQDVHRRTPKRFDDPRQVEQAGVKRRGLVRYAEIVKK